jgi:hypothetical protein
MPCLTRFGTWEWGVLDIGLQLDTYNGICVFPVQVFTNKLIPVHYLPSNMYGVFL